MKVRVYETVVECVDVEVADGLSGDALEAAIEEARVQSGTPRDFCELKETSWEPIA